MSANVRRNKPYKNEVEHSPEVLAAHAEENGWVYVEDHVDWPGSKAYPYKGWIITPGGHASGAADRLDPEPLYGFQGHNDRCSFCNDWIAYTYLDNESMDAKKLCFVCELWVDRSKECVKNDRKLVVKLEDGKTYYFGMGTATKPGPHNGYSGRWFYVRRLNGELLKSCDMWMGGDIPDQFLSLFSVNAELLTPDQYDLLTSASN